MSDITATFAEQLTRMVAYLEDAGCVPVKDSPNARDAWLFDAQEMLDQYATIIAYQRHGILA